VCMVAGFPSFVARRSSCHVIPLLAFKLCLYLASPAFMLKLVSSSEEWNSVSFVGNAS
jgi:hypothetical protein